MSDVCKCRRRLIHREYNHNATNETRLIMCNQIPQLRRATWLMDWPTAANYGLFTAEQVPT